MNYYLYIDELSSSDERLMHKLQSYFVLEGEGKVNHTDVDNALKEPVECINWNVWSNFLYPENNEIERNLFVCGSEFGEMFFAAIARYLNIANKSKSKSQEYRPSFNCVSGNGDNATIRYLDISLRERMERFSALCKKYGYSKTTPLAVNVKFGEKLGDVLSLLAEKLPGQDVCPVHFNKNAGKEKLSIKVCTRDDYKSMLGQLKQEKIIFIVDGGFEDNILTPELNEEFGVRSWLFKNEESLIKVLRAYIESTVIAPAFVDLTNRFIEEKITEISPDDMKEFLSLVKRFPFSFAILPDSIMVERECKIDLGYVGISGKRPSLSVYNASGNVIGEFSDDGVVSFIPNEVGNFNVRWEGTGDYECVIIKNSHIENLSRVATIDVKNHCLTTRMDVVPVGASYGEKIRIPVDRPIALDVIAKNQYEATLTPSDAKDWKYELSKDGEDYVSVERKEMRLTFVSRQAGSWNLHVFWPYANADGSPSDSEVISWKPQRDVLSKNLEINVIGRANRICVKIAPVGKNPSFEVQYMPDKIYFECYPGDVFSLSAWLEGEGDLWNRSVKVEGLGDIAPWDDRDKVIERGFRSTGVKKFVVKSADASEDLVRYIEVNVKVNYSDLSRKWMIGCFALSALVFLCTYGLNWFNFLVYMAPVAVAGTHFKCKFPVYRHLIGGLLAIDLFFVVRALWQEVF